MVSPLRAATALHQRERDGAAQRRALVARRDVADHRDWRSTTLVHELRALGQHLFGVVGEDADELLAVLAPRVFAAPGAPRRGNRPSIFDDHPVHAEATRPTCWCRRSPGPGWLQTAFGAEHVHRLGAVRGNAMLGARLHQRLPQVAPVMPGHVDLEAELAGEADAEDPRVHASDDALLHAHEGEGLGIERHLGRQRSEHVAGAGAGERHRRPLLGHRRAVDLELRPLGLQPFLEPLQHVAALPVVVVIR